MNPLIHNMNGKQEGLDQSNVIEEANSSLNSNKENENDKDNNSVEAENTTFNLFGICQKTVHEDSRLTPSTTEQHEFGTNSRKKSLTQRT